MATYKVPQDIEAEDKLLGPLTLKQFIYAAVTIGLGFIAFVFGRVNILLALIFLPPIALFGFLAYPFKKDQPNEIWLAARIRFLLMPRKRIWDQAGLKELVTVTVPKRIDRQLTNGLSQTEVTSRLQALAQTLDTRGWAVKNVAVNLFSQPAYATANLPVAQDDRLVNLQDFPQAVPEVDNRVGDILDTDNPVSQHFQELAENTAQQIKASAIANLYNNPTQSTSPMQDFMSAHQPTGAVTPPIQPAVPPPTSSAATDDTAVLAQISQQQHQQQAATAHMHHLDPAAIQNPPQAVPQAGILELSQNNDFSVATIAKQAKRIEQQFNDNDTISLR